MICHDVTYKGSNIYLSQEEGFALCIMHLYQTVYHGKNCWRGLEIDKDYVTEEVTVAKRKDGKIAILNVGNLE